VGRGAGEGAVWDLLQGPALQPPPRALSRARARAYVCVLKALQPLARALRSGVRRGEAASGHGPMGGVVLVHAARMLAPLQRRADALPMQVCQCSGATLGRCRGEVRLWRGVAMRCACVA
jgi:hypothetical protein